MVQTLVIFGILGCVTLGFALYTFFKQNEFQKKNYIDLRELREDSDGSNSVNSIQTDIPDDLIDSFSG